MSAGKLRERFAFSRRDEADDGLGNRQGEWIEAPPVAAERIWLRGGEAVMANRLGGRAPAIVKIRFSTAASQITTDWRCRDVRSGEIFNIRQVMPAVKRDYIELLCELGVAV